MKSSKALFWIDIHRQPTSMSSNKNEILIMLKQLRNQLENFLFIEHIKKENTRKF